MSDSGLSRRGLLTGALARLRVADDPAPPRDAASTGAGLVPPVWGRGDTQGLLDGHVSPLLAAAGPLPTDGPVLVAGTGDPALGAHLRRLGLDVTEVHEAPESHRPPGSTGAPLSALPEHDATFAAVLSTCGPMFAREAFSAHAELVRVAAPGAPVVFTAWTGSGAIGRLLRLVARHGALDTTRTAPLTWGREERLRQDLEALGLDFTIDIIEVTTALEDPERGATPLLTMVGAVDPATLPPALREEANALVRDLATRSASTPVLLRSRALLVRTGPPVAAP